MTWLGMNTHYNSVSSDTIHRGTEDIPWRGGGRRYYYVYTLGRGSWLSLPHTPLRPTWLPFNTWIEWWVGRGLPFVCMCMYSWDCGWPDEAVCWVLCCQLCGLPLHLVAFSSEPSLSLKPFMQTPKQKTQDICARKPVGSCLRPWAFFESFYVAMRHWLGTGDMEGLIGCDKQPTHWVSLSENMTVH